MHKLIGFSGHTWMNNLRPGEQCLDTSLESALAHQYQAKNPHWA